MAHPGGNGPAGPIAIQAFLQDLFTGSTTAGATVSRSNVVIAPVPDNLPEIVIGVFVNPADSSPTLFSQTGSLTAPDVTLPAASTPQVSVKFRALTASNVPIATVLTFRAVGTDGSVATGTATVSGVSPTDATLTLNAGVIYQIVVYPATPFTLARIDSGPVPLAEPVLYATSREDRETEIQQAAMISEEELSSPLEKWARAFGAEPQAHKKLAQLHLANQETPQ